MLRNSNEISKNILATLAYYDVFSYPMTSFEIWKYLIRSDYYEKESGGKAELKEILYELKREPLVRFIEEYNGFHFLKGRKEIIDERIKRGKISFAKTRRLRTVISLLRFVPFVRMVCVTGSLAMKTAGPRSDWDVMIAIDKGHIWMGRTLVTVILHLVGKRRYGKKIEDRVCLNHFVTADGLETAMKDLYTSSEYSFIFPVFGLDIFRKFQLENKWIGKIRPQYSPSEIGPCEMVNDSFFSKNIRMFLEKILGFAILEDILRSLEKKKIMSNPKTHQEGSFIRASDDALVFFPEMKGPREFDEFKKRIEELD